MIREIRMEKPATRKNRNRDHVDATRTRDQVGGHGHFAYFEFLKFELAPKSFGGMGIGRDQFDPFGFNRSVHEWLDSLVERGDKAQSQFCHRFSFIWSSSRGLSRFRPGFLASRAVKRRLLPLVLPKRPYESSVSAANNSSTFISRGVSPCSYEYPMIVSSIGALALIP